ncbi:MAG TPA: helix-turn-helix domain-containing protein [Chitinophaga sp.]
MMVDLGVLLTRHHRLLSVAAILDVFESVNKFQLQDGLEPTFHLYLVSHGYPGDHFNQYPLQPLDNSRKYDLILVPAFAIDDMKEAITANGPCVQWLCAQYSQGTAIGSVCTGAFLLAASGLLDQRMATTHINASAAFAAAFPSVHLQEGAVVTQDRGVYTSGGATSTFHLLLRIIENYCGREMSIRIAKYFAIDMDREQQTYFGTFQPTESHHDELVSRLQQRIKKDFSQVSTIEELLNDIPASRRNLARRFKTITGTTPIEYLQRTRIEAAKKILEQASGGVLASMVAAGYSDEKAFRQLFKKTVGMTPSAYRNKYHKRVAETA